MYFLRGFGGTLQFKPLPREKMIRWLLPGRQPRELASIQGSRPTASRERVAPQTLSVRRTSALLGVCVSRRPPRARCARGDQRLARELVRVELGTHGAGRVQMRVRLSRQVHQHLERSPLRAVRGALLAVHDLEREDLGASQVDDLALSIQRDLELGATPEGERLDEQLEGSRLPEPQCVFFGLEGAELELDHGLGAQEIEEDEDQARAPDLALLQGGIHHHGSPRRSL